MATNTSSKAPVVALTADLIDKAKPTPWTVDNAVRNADKVKTPQQAASYLAGAREAIRRADSTKMVAAASAIRVGLRQGMKQVDIANAMGLSQSMVTLYKRMALAMDKGITPASDAATWTALGSVGNDGDVAKVLTDKDTTAEEVKAVAAKAAKAKADAASEKAADKANGKADDKAGRATGGETKVTSSDSAPEGTLKDPRGIPATISLVETLLARVYAGKVTPKAHERLEEIWTALGEFLHPEDAEESA